MIEKLINCMSRAVKTWILTLVLALLAVSARAAEFRRDTKFSSVEAFVTAANAFHPVDEQGELSSLFRIPEPGEDDHGKLVAAPAIQACNVIWSDENCGLVMALAEPPTQATRSRIGILFLLICREGQWQIADLSRFTASGKEADISAELTAQTGSGYHLGKEEMAPVVTVKEAHGGRGYSYQIFASYTFAGSKLKRLNLK